MVLDSDEFLVSYDASKTSELEVLKTCESSGFTATIAKELGQKTAKSKEDTAHEFTPPEFYTQALSMAKEENKPIVVDFMATWCAPCKRISDETFVEQGVAALLDECILLKIDTDVHPEIAKHFNVSGLPDIRFLTPDGEEAERFLGFQDAESFASELRTFLKTIN
jgi:thiol:disulfide interchange protein